MTADTGRSLAPLSLTFDAEFLTTIAYPNADGLAARQAIYQYQVPRVDFVAWTVDRLGLRGQESVVDVGCGNGRFVRAICATGHRGAVLGVDLSRGILADVAVPPDTDPTLVNADIQRLPLAAGAFDLVLSVQMLHHVPSIPTAIDELRRLLAPGGRLVVGVSGEDHLRQLDELIDQAAAPHGLPAREHRFGLANGVGELGRVFTRVEREDLEAELVLRDSIPAIRYLMSMGRLRSTLINNGVDLRAAFVRARDIVDAAIRRDGAYRVTTHMAILKCS